jgi:hypothetical protein
MGSHHPVGVRVTYPNVVFVSTERREEEEEEDPAPDWYHGDNLLNDMCLWENIHARFRSARYPVVMHRGVHDGVSGARYSIFDINNTHSDAQLLC